MADPALRFPLAASRPRAADQVFDALASAILRGQLPPDRPLSAERTLAEQFGVSRILVRQAVHRLEELGLVRIRQGGQTVVLDPTKAKDPRVLVLSIELCVADPALLRDIAQRQLLNGVVLLEAAERNVDEARAGFLNRLIDDLERQGDSGGSEFIGHFWGLIAEATGNQVLEREVHFWFELLERHLGTLRPAPVWDHATRVRIHREVVGKLVRREHAADFYLKEVRIALNG